ncbi:unnamed protein product [Discula destructiva]
MHFHQISLLAALAVVPAWAAGSTASSVNAYFGQNGFANISDVCKDDSLEYLTLAFIDVSPENGGAAGYPGSNFAGHCWAGNYNNNGAVSDLLSDCPYLTPGIDVCQSQYGKKILLSFGGDFSKTSNYSISTSQSGVEFADFIWGAFGPYTEAWEGKPRPFDYNGMHVAVDGYDFDIESAEAGAEGYEAMIRRLRALIKKSGRDDIITGAPQCPLDDKYQVMLPLLKNVEFDRLWIQFYNNPACEILDSKGHLNTGFNYAAWEDFLADTPSANAKLHVGLPGSSAAASTGYVNTSIASSVLCSIQSSDMFEGLMLWDQTFAAANTDEHGVSYNEILYESLNCGCGECPAPTSSSSTSHSATTSSSSTVSATLSSSVGASTTSLSTVSTPSLTSTTSAFTLTSSASGHSHSHKGSHHSLTPSSPHSETSGPTSSTTIPVASSHTASRSSKPFKPSSVGPSGHTVTSIPETMTLTTSSVKISTKPHNSWGNTTWTSSTQAASSFSESSSSTRSSSSVRLSTRPHSWSNMTWTSHSGQASSTDTTQDQLPTSSLEDDSPTSTSQAGAGPTSSGGSVSTHYSKPSSSISTTVVSPSSTTLTGAQEGTSSSSGITATGSPTSSAGVSTIPSQSDKITSTIWSTEVHTITSCAPTVTDCPAGTSYSTTSFPVSTTTVPGTVTSKSDAQSGTPSSSVEQFTTSTVYSTTIYTITSCAAIVTDCPDRLGSVTTEVIAITTTVCPVTATGTSSAAASSPAETGSMGSGSESSHPGSSGSGSTGSESESPGSQGTGAEVSSSSPESVATSISYLTTTSGTLTFTTHIFSTVTMSVPTSSSSAEGSSVPEVANNAGAGAGHAAEPFPSTSTHHNGTAVATKTISLPKGRPTVVAVGEKVSPSKSASAIKPVVTAGVGRSVGGVALAAGAGIVALVLIM